MTDREPSPDRPDHGSLVVPVTPLRPGHGPGIGLRTIVALVTVGLIGFVAGVGIASRPGQPPATGPAPSGLVVATPAPSGGSISASAPPTPVPGAMTFAYQFQPDAMLGAVPGANNCVTRDTSVPGDPTVALPRTVVKTWLTVCPSTVQLDNGSRDSYLQSVAVALPGSTGWSSKTDEDGFEIANFAYAQDGVTGTIEIAISAPGKPVVIAITLFEMAAPL